MVVIEAVLVRVAALAAAAVHYFVWLSLWMIIIEGAF